METGGAGDDDYNQQNVTTFKLDLSAVNRDLTNYDATKASGMESVIPATGSQQQQRHRYDDLKPIIQEFVSKWKPQMT